MNFTVTNFLLCEDGMFFFNDTPDGVWWIPIPGGSKKAYHDGARSAFTIDGKTHYWAWLSSRQALNEELAKCRP